MSKMIFYPQGVNPQGLQKVCFCGNSGDFDRCFEALRQDLFGAVKDRPFVLCRDETPDAPAEEELFLNLGEMKLFAVPVTYRFLTESSRARDVDIPFALENHIPVLPILFDSPEPEILEAFGKVFGELQFLYKYESDPTSIPYGEKLKKYLSDMILDDETAKKIRGAFDAYIFLSYRKKDRKYAKELMRLIHENPLCRDLAIWYDEFLTPGENFNETIAAALDKSALFALAVTPNLVNEINYVMTTEYPMARDAGKPILPAELVPTDGALLKEKYGGIADPVDARSAALSEGLMARLASVALRKNDTDPLHNFFIGLAYLSGVDVEIDHEKAVSLITSAAEANLPEAMEKLAAMYRDGEGVARDYERAVFWTRRRAEYFKAVYGAQGTEGNAILYKDALWNLGDLLSELCRSREAQACFFEFYGLCKELRERFASSWVTRNLSVACGKLGQAAMELANAEEAERYFLEAAELAEAVLSEDLAHIHDLGVVYYNLGNVSRLRGRPCEVSEGYYRKALDAIARVAKARGTVSDRIDLSVCYGQLGSLRLDYGDCDGAQYYLSETLKILLWAREQSDSSQVVWNLATNYSYLSTIAQKRKDLNSAEDLLRRALACLKTPEISATPKGKFDYALILHRMGGLSSQRGAYTSAEAFFSEALEIWKGLAQGAGSPGILRELAVAYDGLGYLKLLQKFPMEATPYYRECFSVMSGLVQRHPTEKYVNDYATFCYRSAPAIPGEGRKAVLRQAAAMWNELAVNFPRNPNYPQKRDAAYALLRRVEQLESSVGEDEG